MKEYLVKAKTRSPCPQRAWLAKAAVSRGGAAAIYTYIYTWYTYKQPFPCPQRAWLAKAAVSRGGAAAVQLPPLLLDLLLAKADAADADESAGDETDETDRRYMM